MFENRILSRAISLTRWGQFIFDLIKS